jgi:predicted PurR-regulated permease PerM
MTKLSDVTIRITTGTIVKVILAVLFVIFLYFIRDIVAIFIVSLLLAMLIDPIADSFERRHVNRGFAVLLVYVGLLAIMTALFFLAVPTVIQQTKDIVVEYQPYFEQVTGESAFADNLLSGEFFKQNPTEVLQKVQNSGVLKALPDILSVFATAFGSLLTVIFVFVLSYYLVVEDKAMRRGIVWLAPKKYKKMILHLIPQVRLKMSQWLHGQLMIMFTLFLVTYIGLTIAQIPFALILAILIGLLELIPFIGPNLAVIPALLVAITVSPWHALFVAVFYFGLQQLEGQVLTPKIMHRVTGLNPVVSLLAVFIGFELKGILGALLAIPLAVIATVILKEIKKGDK